MNTRKKTRPAGIVISVVVVLGALLVINPTFAQSTQTTLTAACNSATINGYVNLNGHTSASVWFEWGSTQSLGNSTPRQTFYSNSNFSQSLSGLSENTTYYYRALAVNGSSTIEIGDIKSFRTPTCPTTVNICANNTCTPTAVTTAATNVSTASARLNGLALINSVTTAVGYFEYGTTQALGTTTQSRNINISGGQYNSFYESLFNLASGVTYYYRAVVTNQYGTSRGEIVSFRTTNETIQVETGTARGNVVVTTSTSNTGTTGTARLSSVFLSVDRDDEEIRRGDLVEYTVSYKNISSRNLRDAVLRIIIPRELKFMETSRGYFSAENSMVVVNIGDLNPQEAGNVHVTIQITNGAEINKVVVITANLAYTIVSSSAQEEVFAYAKNTVLDGNGGRVQLGALALLLGDGFLPDSLLGWLLLFLLIILIILAVRKAYSKPETIVVAGSDHQ